MRHDPASDAGAFDVSVTSAPGRMMTGSLIARTVEVTYLRPSVLTLLIREIYARTRPARDIRPTTKTVVGDIVPREHARMRRVDPFNTDPLAPT